MRRKVIMLAGATALTIGAVISGADAQIERGPAALSAQAQNFTPIEKAACGPHWGRFCGPMASPSLRPLSLLVRPLLSAKANYPVTSSASRPLSGWPYSPVASTTTG